MDTALYHGDHMRDERGFVQKIGGAQEAVQRAMIRLTVPKGSFKPDSELGSRLYTLAKVTDRDKAQELAVEYAQEALLGERDIRVVSARRLQKEDESLWLEFELQYSGEDEIESARVVCELNF